MLLTSNVAAPTETAWKALRFFNLYRIVLSGLFVVFVVSGNLPPPLGSYDHRLFSVFAFFYLFAAILAQVAVERRIGRYAVQTLGQVIIDVVAITLMMYASGGVTSGFGMLLVVTIAAGSILSPGRNALLFAAIASLAVMGEELYSWWSFYLPAMNYTQSGLLGATYFATALLGYVLARRVSESEARAARTAEDLASLERLNEHVVQRMQSGIVALDHHGRIRLMNDSASRLLGVERRAEGGMIDKISPPLAERYRRWHATAVNTGAPLRSRRGGVDILVSFTGLGLQGTEGSLIFLEDAAATRQRAQQFKLVSLGRLAASIAHEIRNPLGAISHAAQLLNESADNLDDNRRLTGIIQDHSQRVNAIVDNVLNLSRRETSVPESFELLPWLEHFVRELSARHALEDGDVLVSVTPADMQIRMDRGQFQQVLWNLCENGLRYSRTRPKLELRCGVLPSSQRPYLDVIDHGPGIPVQVEDNLFEPFFTTEKTGTGLGLYIAAELCESNQASLGLYSNTAEGCCFRINFAPPARQQLTAG